MTPDQIKSQSKGILIKLFPHLANETDTLDFYNEFLQEIQTKININDFRFSENKETLIIKADPSNLEQKFKIAEHLDSYLFEIIDGYKITNGVTNGDNPYTLIEIEIPS